MTSNAKRTGSGKAVTAPKGRPTAGRGETTERASRITPTMEWIIALVIVAAVIVGLVLVFGDVRGTQAGLGVAASTSRDLVGTFLL